MPRKSIRARYLDSIELSLLNNGGAQVVEYDGKIDDSALSHAFKLLCLRYPVLRSQVSPDSKGYLLHVPSQHQPEFVVLNGNEDTLYREVRKPWAPEREMARLILVHGNNRGLAAVRMDHAIVDARSWTTMFYELWRIYTDIISGRDVNIVPGSSLPCSPSALFAKHFGWTPEGYAVDRGDAENRSEAVQGRIKLCEQSTTQLITHARKLRVSVHALVCSAIIVSHRFFAQSANIAERMMCLSPIDFRGRVNPPVGATETTNFLRMHIARLDVSRSPEILSVSRDIKSQLDSALSTPRLSGTDRAWLYDPSEASDRKLGVVLVSNIGNMPPIPQTSDAVITDWRRLVPMTTNSFPTYGVYTYDSRLTILYFYSSDSFRQYEVQELTSHIENTLRSIGRS